jgi:hypothetical protein
MEGEADDAVVAHIKECAFCSEKVTQWSRMQNRLKRQLYRVTCPTSTELGDYHLGLLPASQALVVAQHVRQCPLCRSDLVKLEKFLLEEQEVTEEGVLGTARVLIARLISGSIGEAARMVPALRGGAKGPLTFEADGVVLVLDIQQNQGGKASILGQVAADDQDQWTGALVEFWQDNELESSTTIDDLGAFRSDGVRPGFKELRIMSKDTSLTVVSNFTVSV